jgi:hypothetical protein
MHALPKPEHAVDEYPPRHALLQQLPKGVLMAQQITVPITREKLEEKRKEAAAQGFKLDGDSGNVFYSQFSIDASYKYDGANLVITINKKPWYVPGGSIESAVKGWFA